MKKNSEKAFLISVIISAFFLIPTSLLLAADGGGSCPGGSICIPNPLEADTIEEVLDSVVNFIFALGIIVSPLMILVAAFYLITAGGDPKRVETARQIILYTSIGLAVIFFAKGLVSVIKHILGV